MRAVRVHALTGPSGVSVDEIEAPSAPGAGDVEIEVQAAGLNFPDVLLTHGKYQFKPAPPFIPGGEGAGVVSRVGAGVSYVKPGDRVAFTLIHGAFAEKVVVPEATVVRVPDGVAIEVAAATLLTYLTTIHALVDRAAIQTGEIALGSRRGGWSGRGSDSARQSAGREGDCRGELR